MNLNTNQFRSALLAKREELLRRAPEREEISVERLSDAIDDVQRAANLDLTIASINMNWETIRHIDQALAHIEEGDYGICEDCEQPISEKRLMAVPWASLCRNCQEREDMRQHDVAA